MKKLIVLSSFLFLFLLSVIPVSVSHAAEQKGINDITVVTDQGDIKAVKVGDTYTIDLVGVPGTAVVEQIKVTSDKGVSLSLVPEGLSALLVGIGVNPENLDVKFVDHEAVVTKEKLTNWLERIGASQSADKFPVQQLTVNGLRSVLSVLSYDLENYAQAPLTFIANVTDQEGQTSSIDVHFKLDGWKQVNHKWYYFDVFGEKVTGWLDDNAAWYYLNEDGSMKTGWVELDGKWYYLNADGDMATGWKKVGTKWYYLNADGDMVTGWKKVGTKWYYLNADGDMVTGWKKVGTKWYYLNADGDMATGWKKVGTKWYYLNGDGDMVTGWKKVGTKWYYLNAGGDMATGWVKVNSSWYYLKSDGSMAANTWIGSYKIGPSGAWIK